jgi:beta-galactosidase
MYFGGDYNPEQWDRDVWREDVKLMQIAHVDLVTLGVFSWASIERREGEFDFGWMDEVIALLDAAGIGIDLATGTASVPNWAVAAYPEILPVDESGLTISPGSRQHYSPNSPDYRRLAGRFAARIAERYAAHPAVRMWHVNNEYACHVRYDYSENAARGFRAWLRDRYGSIDRVNDAWGTAFWSQSYLDFDEIIPPRRAAYSHIPGLVLDFRRFTSDSVLELYIMERDAIRAAGALQPITTNFMDAFPPMDYWRWAREVDVVSNDNYSDPRRPDAFRQAAFGRDLMRSLKPSVPWILMEQSTNAVNWRLNNAAKAPGQMTAWSEQAMARGAGGVMFFQWRQSRAGAEMFHSAMLPHAGVDTRVFREVRELGEVVSARVPEVVPKARIGIVIDWESWWAVDQADLPARLDYEAIVRAWYDVLHAAHHAVDFVPPSGPFDDFDLVIAPALYLLRPEDAVTLTAFVDQGGVLLTTAFTDIVDEADGFRPGGFATQLGPVFGAVPTDFAGVLDVDGIRFEFGPAGPAHRPTGLIEDLRVQGGDVVAWFSNGLPAVVEHRVGDGRSIHVATFPDASGIAVLVDYAAELAGIAAVVSGVPPHVEAIRTGAGLTLINQSAAPVAVDGFGEPLAPFEVRRIAER